LLSVSPLQRQQVLDNHRKKRSSIIKRKWCEPSEYFLFILSDRPSE
jgi:hypothetical protein